MSSGPPPSASLFRGVYSVTSTKRRRFFWAAWWTAPPEAEPFRKPDASNGGVYSRDEARAAAEKAAGQELVEIEGRWAGAWSRILRGQPPWIKRSVEVRGAPAAAAPPPKGSKPWALGVLGLVQGATALEIKRAFKAIALRTHPDHGGEDAAFIDAKRAYDVALAAVLAPRRRRRKR